MSSDEYILALAEKAGIAWGQRVIFNTSELDAMKSQLYARTEFSAWFSGISPSFNKLSSTPLDDIQTAYFWLPEQRAIAKWCSDNDIPFDVAACLLFLGKRFSEYGAKAELGIIEHLFGLALEIARKYTGVSDMDLLHACHFYGAHFVPNVCVQTDDVASVLRSGSYFNAHHINANPQSGISSTGMQAGFTSDVIAEMRRYIESRLGIPSHLPDEQSLQLRPSSGYILHASTNRRRSININQIHGIDEGSFCNLPISLSSLCATGLDEHGTIKYGADRIVLRSTINQRVMVYPGDATLDSFSNRRLYAFQDIIDGRTYGEFGDIFSAMLCTRIYHFPYFRSSPFEFTHGRTAREYSEALILGSFDVDDIVAATMDTRLLAEVRGSHTLSGLCEAIEIAAEYKREKKIDVYVHDGFIDLEEVELQNPVMGIGWLRLLEHRHEWESGLNTGRPVHPIEILESAVKDGVFQYHHDCEIERLSRACKDFSSLTT